MFFKKEDKKEDIPLSKIGSLLIHAAKIDEHYSNEEEEVIKKMTPEEIKQAHVLIDDYKSWI